MSIGRGFGSSVAIGDSLAVIGNGGDDGGVSTARFLYDPATDGFTYEVLPDAFLPDPSTGGCDSEPPEFGFTVAVVGDEDLFVGIPGFWQVRHYRWDGATWGAGTNSPVATILPPNDELVAREFSCLDGNGTIPGFLVCDHDAGGSGGSDCFDASDENDCVFTCEDSTVISEYFRCNGAVNCSDASDETDCPDFTTFRFGHSIAVSDEILVVGAPGDDGRTDGGSVIPERGSVFVYRRIQNGDPPVWDFVQKIVPSGTFGRRFGKGVDIGPGGSIIVAAEAAVGASNGTVSIYRPVFTADADATAGPIFPGVGALADGGFVVTWQEEVDVNVFREMDVFAQRFDSDGTPSGFESSPSPVRVDPQRSIRAAGGDEGFLAAWVSTASAGDGSGAGIFARSFTTDGVAHDDRFAVNAYTTGGQERPAIAGAGDGRFTVLWTGAGSGDTDAGGIFGRAVARGAAHGDQFRVNEFTVGSQTNPAVARISENASVAVWQSAGEDGAGDAVVARLLDADSAPDGPPFQVNVSTAASQNSPDVASRGDGSFVIVWESDGGQDGNASGVFARAYHDSTAGDEFQVNVHTAGDQDNAKTAVGPSGDVVFVWESDGQDGSGVGIFSRSFAADGQGRSEQRVNVDAAGDQVEPDVEVLSDGTFVVVWQATEGLGTKVMARRLAADGSPAGPEFRVDNISAQWELARRFAESDLPQGITGLGTAVSIADNAAVLGAPGDGIACGDAFVTELVGGAWQDLEPLADVWRQQAPVDPNDPFQCVRFGSSVAIDSDVVLVAAPGPSSGDAQQGRVYPFQRVAGAVPSVTVSSTSGDAPKPARFGKPGLGGQPWGPSSCPADCYAAETETSGGKVMFTCECEQEVQPDARRSLVCGNGRINRSAGELCDDGNVESGDCCDSDCQPETTGAYCDDGIECTIDACDGEGTCSSVRDDSACGDGILCNGEEYCDPANDCQNGESPCQPGETCVENGPTCVPVATCGAPDGSGPTASDCLFILNVAVGLRTCEPVCACDTNGNGGAPNATDALVCLNAAVGIPGLLNCPC